MKNDINEEPNFLVNDPNLEKEKLEEADYSKLTLSQLDKLKIKEGLNKYNVPEDMLVNKEESTRLLELIDKDKPETIWRFIIGNMPFINYIIKKRFYVVSDEMISDGVMGMYRALAKYDHKYPYNVFMTYSVHSILQYVRLGMCQRTTQLDPARRIIRKKIKTHTIETSFEIDNEISCGSGKKRSLKESTCDPLETNSSIDFEEHDSSLFFKKVLKNLKRYPAFKKEERFIQLAMQIISETDSGFSLVSEISKRLGCSRQYASVKIKKIREIIDRLLKDKPQMKKDLAQLMGHKYRDRTDAKEIKKHETLTKRIRPVTIPIEATREIKVIGK